MPTNTYVALDKVTVGTATPSITFSSISGSYTDLVLVMDLGAGTAGVDIYCQVNGDTATNYSHTRLTGNGTAASSSRGTSLAYMRFSDGGSPQTTANSVTQVSFMNYSNTTTYKTALNRASNGNRGTDGVVNLWRSTAAITSITVYLSSGNITAGSTFSLYGIKADTNAYTAKATGGTITADVGYIYHTFTSSGTFTPTVGLTADVLVVAGGGGAATGGGGAGGILDFTSQSFTTTGYTVTVGGGGGGAASTNPNQGGVGSDSQFGALTLVKGGGGGGGTNVNGGNGGSGGGAGRSTAASGGTATSGQGNNGGSTSAGHGSGGGGKSAAGGNSTSASGASGGSGSNAWSVWATATSTGASGYYGGGGGGGSNGGGGAGGAGGGGAGGNTSATAGTVNTGGGAGGVYSGTGAAGGSGIVIVRYAK